MNFDLNSEEKLFESEVERFLEEQRSEAVMDANPEQLFGRVPRRFRRTSLRAGAWACRRISDRTSRSPM